MALQESEKDIQILIFDFDLSGYFDNERKKAVLLEESLPSNTSWSLVIDLQ